MTATRLVRGLHRVPRARARVRDAADAGARRRRRPRQALGHRRNAVFNEILGFYGLHVLVRVAGHDPRPRTDLAERQRRGPQPRGRSGSTTARCSRSASPSATTAPTSTRPTWSSTPGRRRRLQRHGRQVLHRQRQRGRHGVGVRPPRGRRGSRRLRVLRRRQPAPGLQADQERRARRRCTSARSTSRTTRSRAEDVLHTGVDGVRGGAEHDQRRQVQPRLLRRSAWPSTASTRRSPRPRTASCSASRSPSSARSAASSSRPTRGCWRCKALRRPRGRLRAQRQPRGPPLPALHADQQDAGDDRGRAVIALLGEVISAKGFERDTYFASRQEHRRGCPSSRARCTSTSR